MHAIRKSKEGTSITKRQITQYFPVFETDFALIMPICPILLLLLLLLLFNIQPLGPFT
jgi:hypothetical protein